VGLYSSMLLRNINLSINIRSLNRLLLIFLPLDVEAKNVTVQVLAGHGAGCAASVEGMTGTTRCCSLASHLYFYQNSKASLLSEVPTALLFRLIKLATILVFQTNQQLRHLPKLNSSETLVFFPPCFTYAAATYP